MDGKYNERKKDQQDVQEENSNEMPGIADVKQKKHFKRQVNPIKSDKTKLILKTNLKKGLLQVNQIQQSSSLENSQNPSEFINQEKETFLRPQNEPLDNHQSKFKIDDQSEQVKGMLLMDKDLEKRSSFRRCSGKEKGEQFYFNVISEDKHQLNNMHDEMRIKLVNIKTPLENDKTFGFYAPSEKDQDSNKSPEQLLPSCPKLISNHIINSHQIQDSTLNKQTQKQTKKLKEKPKQVPRCYCHYLNCRTNKCGCFIVGRLCTVYCHCISCSNLESKDANTGDGDGYVNEKIFKEENLSLGDSLSNSINLEVAFAPFFFDSEKEK